VRIGIDARELCGRPTGVGRYLTHLLTSWGHSAEAAEHRFSLYAPAGEPGDRLPARLAASGLRVETRTVPGGSGTWWEQVNLASALRRDRPDVLFAPAYTSPLAVRIPTVLTIHDVSFLAHPEWFPLRLRVRQRLVTTVAARRARMVLTDSEFSRGEIVRRLGIAPARIQVIPLGLTRPARERPSSVERGREPLILFVGSIFNRRHLPDMIQAVAVVAHRRPEVRLEIVGDDRTYPPQDLGAIAAAAGIGDRTRVRSYVADDVLAGLYARAGAFVFLSDYEGFGLTPLEALSYGVPVLVGDTPVAREVYGDAASYVATTDVAAAAAALDAILFDAETRAALLSKADAVLGRYSWERAGRQTLSALIGASGGCR
jgi:glycosyltransferase involved in cell wall biosynthesis